MPELASLAASFGDECSDIGDLLELLARSRPDWHADAACREAPADVSWFPEKGGDSRPAKAVCGRCLVRAECAAWAAGQETPLAGIWGGLSDRERRQTRPAVTRRPRQERQSQPVRTPARSRAEVIAASQDRERRAVQLEAEGRTVKEIAVELGLHHTNVYRTLQRHSMST